MLIISEEIWADKCMTTIFRKFRALTGLRLKLGSTTTRAMMVTASPWRAFSLSGVFLRLRNSSGIVTPRLWGLRPHLVDFSINFIASREIMAMAIITDKTVLNLSANLDPLNSRPTDRVHIHSKFQIMREMAWSSTNPLKLSFRRIQAHSAITKA